MNNKFIILLTSCFCFLTSCSTPFHLTSDETNQLNQSSYVNYLEIAQTESTLYYIDEMCDLYAYESRDTSLKLRTLYFIDDQEVDNIAQFNQSPKRYSDLSLAGRNLQVFNDGLIYASMYASVEGSISYHLNYLTKDGLKRYEILELDYEPNRFFLQNKSIIIEEFSDNQEVLHCYSLDGEEIKQIQFDEDIYNLYGYENFVYVKLTNELVQIDLTTFDKKSVCSGDVYVALYNGKVSYYTLENDGSQMHSGIKNISDGNVVYSIDGCIIDYFDDSYIYTTSYDEEHTTYRIYDWNDNLIKEIRPYDTLGESELGAMPIALKNAEYSTIARIWNHQLIGSCYGNQGMRIYSCDIDSGKCKFIIN